MMGFSLLRGGVPLCLVLGLVWACGSSSKKTAVQLPSGDAGEAGAGGETSASGGSSGGTAGSSVGGAAGVAEAGSAAIEGGAGGEPGEGGAGGAGPAFHGLYIGIDGLDTNGGSHDEPFLTLAHAVFVAQPGDTLVFLDGTFAPQPGATIPDGVDVMAESSGAAKLKCSFQNLFTFAGTSRVEGLEFDACPQPIVATASGKLTMVDLFFVNGGTETGAVHIGGKVAATLTGASDHVYTLGGANLFFISDTASLSVTGGVFKSVSNGGFTGNGLFRTADAAKLTLKDLTVVDTQQATISSGGTSVVVVDHCTMDLLAQTVILLREQSSFTSKNGTRLALKPTAPSRFECLRSELTSGSVLIDDTEITGCSAAINSVMPTTLTITNSKIDHNDGLAIDLSSFGSSAPIVALTIGNTEISDNGSVSTQIHGGIRIGGSAIYTVKFRGLTMKNIGGTFADATGMYLLTATGSSFDFGTLADPGLNTFQTNGLGVSIRAQAAGLAGVTIPAVGNTWTPSTQSADPQGKYSVPTGGPKVFEVTGPVSVNTGAANYTLSTTTTLRLAQIP